MATFDSLTFDSGTFDAGQSGGGGFTVAAVIFGSAGDKTFTVNAIVFGSAGTKTFTVDAFLITDTPTRLYYGVGTVPISPAYDASWEATGSAVRKPLEPFKLAGVPLETLSVASAAVGPADVLVAQYVSPPLDGDHTLRSAVRGQIMAETSSGTADHRAQLLVWVRKPDGTSRGTFISHDTGALASEFAGSPTNRKFPRGGRVAPVGEINALDGDRIIVEVGYRKHVANATSYVGYLNNLGNPEGTDLPENETATSGVAWIEFDDELTFATEATARVTQDVAEVLYAPTSAQVRVTQDVTEVLYTTTQGQARVTQDVLEVLISPTIYRNLAVDAVLAPMGFPADAVLFATMTPGIGSAPSGFYVEYEWVDSGKYGLFTVDAVAFSGMAGTPFTLDAVIREVALGSFTVDARIPPRFTVDAIRRWTVTVSSGTNSLKTDAAIVRRPTASTTADAIKFRLNMAGSFTVNAFFLGWFTVDAGEILQGWGTPKADAWIYKNNWLFTFSAGADIVPVGEKRGLIYLDAWIRATPATVPQAGLEVGLTNADPPVRVSQAGFEAAWSSYPDVLVPQAGFEAAWTGAPYVVVPQAGFEMAGRPLDGTVKVSQIGYERGITWPNPDIFVSMAGIEVGRRGMPGFLVAQAGFEYAAEIAKGSFRINAMFYRPGEYMPPATRTIDAALVWRITGTPWTVDAFLQWYMAVDAVRKVWDVPGTPFTLSAAISIRRYASFTVNAFKQGFIVYAVIKSDGYWAPEFIFNVYARVSGPTGSFTANAWVTGTLGTFTANAVRRRSASASTTVSAWLSDFWWHKVSMFLVDAILEPPIISTPEDFFWVEAFFVPDYRTVVYEGEDGSSHVERVLVTERLQFPGFPNVGGNSNSGLAIDNCNNLYGPFITIDLFPVTITLYEMPSWGDRSIGVHGMYQNVWLDADAPGTYVFYPADYRYESFVYTNHEGKPYDPTLTGSGMVSFWRDDTIIDALPAPTIDAWLVGTPGEPFTLDAEIVGTLKLRVAYLDAWINDEVNWTTFTLDAKVLSSSSGFFLVNAVLAEGRPFTLDAVLADPVYPGFTLDAAIRPYFTVAANIKKTVVPVNTQTGKGPTIDAVKVRNTQVRTITLDYEIVAATDKRSIIRLDAVIKANRSTLRLPGRFYLLAMIRQTSKSFGVAAYIGSNFAVSAFIQPRFTVGAYIRGKSYIIYPEDGGPPTDLYGDAPPLGRSFRVKIEAGIADPVPIGNDAEIERLIALILEAEAELEAMYCAVTHYSSQGAPSTSGHSNPSGTGYNRSSSLPRTISQIGYPGAGDIDDCWVVATVWAAIASGETYRPNCRDFRRWANNPDRPGPTGGTLTHIMNGARKAWPDHRIRRYQSTSWDGFTSMLKAGWTASLAIRCSALPSRLRYGFGGRHQVGIAYQDGKYWIADPLAPNNSLPKQIDGIDLRRAARGFVGGTICAALFR